LAEESTPIAVIRSGDNKLGIVWESHGVQTVMFNDPVAIDVNRGIEIVNVNNDKHEFIDVVEIVSDKVNKLLTE
jgi:hypothetical protein